MKKSFTSLHFTSLQCHKYVIAVLLLMTAILPAGLAQEVTSSGALSYTYPLDLPQGRNGMGPSLSLVYNSNAGNGMLGVGWSLGGLSIITRDSSYDVTFDDTTDHFLLDGQKLILGGDTYYHTEKESYVRIEFFDKNLATACWVVTLKNGTKMYYGYRDADHNADGSNDGNVTAVQLPTVMYI